MLWTRAQEGSRRPLELRFEIAHDASFDDLVLAGVTSTGPERDWTVKVDVRDPSLRPFTSYRYRFVLGDAASPTGRFRTLPAADQALGRLTLGQLSCQDHTNGWFTALRWLAREDVDYVLHLGDFIYETPGGAAFQVDGPPGRRLRLPSGRDRAETLDDYRFLHREYRRDADLRRLLGRHTLLAIWDDHEFANDGYGPYDTDTDDEAANLDPARRAAATRAWTEYLPVGPPDDAADDDPHTRVYRGFRFGRLAELALTDERQYRDAHPCGVAESQRYATRGCPERLDPGRTMLGDRPARLVRTGRLARTDAAWRLWGNETMVMPLVVPGWLGHLLHPAGERPDGDVLLSLDQWDGFPAERAALARIFAGLDDVVVLTGDLHSFVAGTLPLEADRGRVAPRRGLLHDRLGQREQPRRGRTCTHQRLDTGARPAAASGRPAAAPRRPRRAAAARQPAPAVLQLPGARLQRRDPHAGRGALRHAPGRAGGPTRRGGAHAADLPGTARRAGAAAGVTRRGAGLCTGLVSPGPNRASREWEPACQESRDGSRS